MWRTSKVVSTVAKNQNQSLRRLCLRLHHSRHPVFRFSRRAFPQHRRPHPGRGRLLRQCHHGLQDQLLHQISMALLTNHHAQNTSQRLLGGDQSVPFHWGARLHLTMLAVAEWSPRVNHLRRHSANSSGHKLNLDHISNPNGRIILASRRPLPHSINNSGQNPRFGQLSINSSMLVARRGRIIQAKTSNKVDGASKK